MNKKLIPQHDIYNTQNLSRQIAIQILESIAEKLGDETIFDCNNGDTKWYDFEDMVTFYIEKARELDRKTITRRNRQIKALKKQIKDMIRFIR